jgi:hypothetical protein
MMCMYDVSGSKYAAMVAKAGHQLVGLLLAGSVNSIDCPGCGCWWRGLPLCCQCLCPRQASTVLHCKGWICQLAGEGGLSVAPTKRDGSRRSHDKVDATRSHETETCTTTAALAGKSCFGEEERSEALNDGCCLYVLSVWIHNQTSCKARTGCQNNLLSQHPYGSPL